MTDEERAYNYASKQKASKFQIGEIAKFYNDGYHQAEEDNELTWKDIEKICLIAKEVHQFRGFWSEHVYKEVLKRFKDFKERKEK
jgi:hypothetical protein